MSAAPVTAAATETTITPASVESSTITPSPPTAEAGARNAISPEIVPEKWIVVEIVAVVSAGRIIPIIIRSTICIRRMI
jgi:hypothetical protein